MITPFTASHEVDERSLERLVEWYVQRGVHGLFAVCQSSEMFYLSLEERVRIARLVKEKAAGRVPVIASGHISDRLEDQVKELLSIAETGVDAVVLITNRLAAVDESDEVFLHNLERLLRYIPEDLMLGFYECPYPYKRIISPEILSWCAETGRFHFLKDTSCDIDNISRKLDAVRDSQLRIFNANTATLLESLKLGVAGYSGVMANFQPELYVWLLNQWSNEPDKAEQLIDFLSLSALIEKQMYPVNAKYGLVQDGIFDQYVSRTQDYTAFTNTLKLEVEQLRSISKRVQEKYVPIGTL